MDSLYMQANYRRMGMVGGNLSFPIGKFVIRTEGATYIGELQEMDKPNDLNTTLKKNSLNGLLGLDYYPGNDWTIMLQYSHKYITDYEEQIEPKKNTGLATLNLSKKLLQTSLTLKSFTYYDVTYNGFYNRTSFDYALNDQIHFMGGYDWFHGNKGSFAIFKNNSGFFMKLKYNF